MMKKGPESEKVVYMNRVTRLSRFLHELHLVFDFIDGLQTCDISVQGIFMFTQTEHRSTAPNAVPKKARFMTTQAL
jgi:hypothetical protein